MSADCRSREAGSRQHAGSQNAHAARLQDARSTPQQGSDVRTTGVPAVHAAQVHAAPAVRARNSAAAPTASARTCARPPGLDVCRHPRGRRPKRCRSGRTGQPRTTRTRTHEDEDRGSGGHDGDGRDGGNREPTDTTAAVMAAANSKMWWPRRRPWPRWRPHRTHTPYSARHRRVGRRVKVNIYRR